MPLDDAAPLDDVDPLAPLRARPDASGVFTDFDGTLSAIVDDPAAARPVDGAAEVLGRLAAVYRSVAVVSGRPVAFLERFLPPSVVLSGLYGLEVRRDGERRDHPGVEPWRPVIDEVAARSRAEGPRGMLVEHKGASLTLHYREHPDLAAAVHQWADGQAAQSGLAVRPARRSVELHPPLPVDKGTAVADLAAGLAGAVFIGDDAGDVPAFRALGTLAAAGMHAVRVAVASTEAPASLLDEADLVVDGPAGAVELLASLLAPPG